MFLRIAYTIPASLQFTCWMLQSLDHNSNNTNGYIVTLNQLSGTQHFYFYSLFDCKTSLQISNKLAPSLPNQPCTNSLSYCLK